MGSIAPVWEGERRGQGRGKRGGEREGAGEREEGRRKKGEGERGRGKKEGVDRGERIGEGRRGGEREGLDVVYRKVAGRREWRRE